LTEEDFGRLNASTISEIIRTVELKSLFGFGLGKTSIVISLDLGDDGLVG
jgi:hypothetical protein